MKKKLQVFVSSTYVDLIEDRQAAVGAILKSGHIPAGMELFTSGNQSQMKTIRKWIDESDAYMLILGGRYGSIEKTTGISYTELEYDYAVQQEKALFAIVINEDTLETRVKEFGTSFMEKENPKQLKMFREKVLSNISSFFEDSKDIKLCVYESLSDYATDNKLKGWVSADEVTNSQQLLDEITSLRKENTTLLDQLVIAEKKIMPSGQNHTSKQKNEELIDVLKSIEIKVPSNISPSKKEYMATLYDIFDSQRDNFVIGVTNQINISDLTSFLYFNICPKLQIHDLVILEKVPSVQWRRFSTTKKGNQLLAYIEQKKLIEKPESNKT